jgi:exodeoxyribonuclease V gamma subunit
MSLRVFWSDRLEMLADRMLDEWTFRASGNPFERTCVAVGDMATRNWLKDRFLLHREPGVRRVLANIDFTPLPAFANDWLAAAVHGQGGGCAPRNPADHPFSKGVMAWRIDAILREKAGAPEFRTLVDYVAAGGDKAADRRRFDLATRLAQMFDDYLVSRAPKMRAWERGIIPPGGDERWQALLYRELAKNADSYAADYEKALAPDFDPERAFANGFPRYAAVHVFDVMDAPLPYLEMLKRISETIPVTFWTFNPSRDFWVGNPTKSQALREKAARLRAVLERGETPEPDDGAPDFSSPDSRLLGTLATGARGMINRQLDLAEGNREWLGDENAEDFASLRAAGTEVHVCHSPRRELEAARDALHRFFKENDDAKPSDALVLCADWPTYSPLVEAVFGGKDGEGADGKEHRAAEQVSEKNRADDGAAAAARLPVATAGIAASSPVAHSFDELLDFRTNRFEVSKVFLLLGVPEIREKFGIDADGLAVLRDMVRKDNIHWGFDDEDVRNVLGQEAKPEDEQNRFTWQRGLDRLTLDALLGPRQDEGSLYEAGALGRLLPGGNVESDRAKLVAGLFRFTKRLMAFRRLLRKNLTAENWRDGLLAAIDDFYKENDASLGEILGLRRAVDATADAAIRARETDGRPSVEKIPGEVFCSAVAAAVRGRIRPLASAGDAVRIAPLSNGSAVPARFVWICGLNDGTFPRNEYRPTFDLIGRHPTMYDVTPRERDAMALLKAALGARDKLCLSYVGRDIRTNKEYPPAVPLTDLLEWFRASGVATATFDHPLQPYSERYFRTGDDAGLPPSYSKANRAAAEALAGARAKGRAAAKAPQVVPFPPAAGEKTIVELDDLAAFFEHPNQFIARQRLRIRFDDVAYDRLDDDDELGGGLPKALSDRILVRGGDGAVEDFARESEALMESGMSLAADEISRLVDSEGEATSKYRERTLRFTDPKAEEYKCSHKSAAEALAEWQDGARSMSFEAPMEIDGHSVAVHGEKRTVELDTDASGRMEYTFGFSDIYDSTLTGQWVRHVAGHAAGFRFVSALMCRNPKATVKTFPPIPQDEAKRLLEAIVRTAMKPWPFDAGLVGDWESDVVPEDIRAAIGFDKGRIVATDGRGGKRK